MRGRANLLIFVLVSLAWTIGKGFRVSKYGL
jgi:hypothetical protein